jgi:predicted ester cyclase
MAAAAQTETTAGAAANKALVRRFMEEVFNRGNLAVVDELWKPDRIEGGRRATEHLRTAFPDYHRTIEAQVAEGDLVVTRWTMRGTHRGPYRSGALGRTLAPTGRRVEVPGISIHRLAGGRIVESWVLGNDSLPLLQQLGALPEAEPAPRP